MFFLILLTTQMYFYVSKTQPYKLQREEVDLGTNFGLPLVIQQQLVEDLPLRKQDYHCLIGVNNFHFHSSVCDSLVFNLGS